MFNPLGRLIGVLVVAGVVAVSGNGLAGAEVASVSSNSQNQSVLELGTGHSCALLVSGEVNCWGANASGQLGNNSLDARSRVPVLVSGISTAVAVSAGGGHSCALLVSGEVNCWGANESGQLGNNSLDARSRVPVVVLGISTAVAVSAGLDHSCALLASGAVNCWGANYDRQLGNDSLIDSRRPVAVSNISTAVAVSAGDLHSCALLVSREVWCWGWNGTGQLGNASIVSSPIPVLVSNISTAVAVSAGAAHSCALLVSREVWCWGWNVNGQLGNASIVNSPIPVLVANISAAVAVSVGDLHSCALLVSGGVQCWGRNASGQLGDNSLDERRVPVAVANISTAVAVSSSGDHSCALLVSGGVQCWGANSAGQLGINSLDTRSLVPVGVFGLSSGVGVPTTTSTSTTTTTAVPVVVRAAATTAPLAVSYRAANRRVTMRWGAVNGATSYVVTTTAGTQVCATTTATNCVVSRLSNGRAYNYLVFSINADGVRSETSTRLTARPGFQVRNTTVKATRSVSLSSIVTTPSRGTKTWRVTSGACRIQGTRLVASPQRGTCRLRLATARSGSYAPMSTSINISVSR